MFSMRTVGSIFILLFPSQTAMPQSQSNLRLAESSLVELSVGTIKAGKRATPTSTLRTEELKRRAYDPETSGKATGAQRAEYSAIVSGSEPLTGEDILRIKNTKLMPPTSCKSIYEVPKDPKRPTQGPWFAHDATVHLFASQSGFGYWRMAVYKNSRGQVVGSPEIDRVELVSLLTGDEPAIYVLDELATPPVARLARRRPLDEFEQLGLDAVRRGSDLVSTTEAPSRMFGAIRATNNCLECHTGAKENDLLGAFTYYLETSTDKLK